MMKNSSDFPGRILDISTSSAYIPKGKRNLRQGRCPVRRFLFVLSLLGSVALVFAEWPPEVLLHRQSDEGGPVYERIEGLGD